jgi:hypothetical protein
VVKTANRIGARNGAAADPLETLASLDPVKLSEQIAALEQERDNVVSGFQNKIDALRVLEKAANIRVNGKPPRKKPEPRKKKEAPVAANGQRLASPEGTIKDRIVRYLQINQPAKVAVIAADLQIPAGSVSGTISSYRELFDQAPNDAGWRLKRSRDDD